jgi:hypothetical protein
MALANGWPSMGIFSDEGGRFIGGYSMSADQQVKTAAGLSSLWDGKPISRMRSGDGAMLLYGRRVSMHIMVQPQVSNLLFSNRMLIEQGLMSRALVAFPDTTIGDRPYVSENVLNDPAMIAYQARMKAILDAPLPLVEGEANELEPRSITLDDDAKAVWVQFHDHIEALCKAGRELAPVRGFAAKAAEHAARIAGILTLFDDLSAMTIDQAHLEAGIELAQYYIGEALRLFNGAQDDPDLLLAEELLGWIQERGGLIYARLVYHDGPNAIRNKNDAQRILKVLEDHRWIIPIDGGAEVDGSHRKQLWRVWS